MWRIVKQDTELGGMAIPAGSVVQLRYAGTHQRVTIRLFSSNKV